MDREKAKYLVEKSFKDEERNIAMVHGTSSLAVRDLISKDILPGGREDGFMYFFPVKEHIANFPIYREVKEQNLPGAETLASREAQINERSILFNKIIGAKNTFTKRDCASQHDLERISNVDSHETLNLRELFTKLGLRDLCSTRNLLRTYRKFEECGGVVLGVHKKILEDIDENRIEIDEEHKESDISAVRIHLPDGLPARYVASILPLGDWEEREILKYIDEIPKATPSENAKSHRGPSSNSRTARHPDGPFQSSQLPNQ